jgi:hypothetical protein
VPDVKTPQDQPKVKIERIRRSHYSVTLAAGARWPGATDSKPDRWFRWVKIDNVGASDLDFGWSPTFVGGDLLDSGGSVAPGTTRVLNTGDPVGQIYIFSTNGTSFHISLDDEPIVDLISQSTVGSAGPGTSSSTLTSVASSATSVQLVASNTDRRALDIYNDSTQILYIAFAATASTSAYTLHLGSQAFYEMPVPVYTGIVSGIWASANGNARITELS